jgi:small subunit ribosomal protein S17e
MGRIKTKAIKRVTEEFIEKYEDKIAGDFEGNKKLVDQHTDVQSKKLRNIIAGYATRRGKTRANQ